MFLLLFLDEKKQKSSQQEASLPHKAFALQTGQNLGWPFLPHYVRTKPLASAKIPYALQPHKATIVLPAFARSFLLTEEKKKDGEILKEYNR